MRTPTATADRKGAAGVPRDIAEQLTFLRRYSGTRDTDLVERMRELGIAHASTEWLEHAARGAVPVSDAEQRVVARALAVPAAYFDDPAVTAVVDAVLVLAAELRERGVELIGPCRHGPVSAQDYLGLYAALLCEVMLPNTE